MTSTENAFHRRRPGRNRNQTNNRISHRSRPLILNLGILTLSCTGLAAIVVARAGPLGGMVIGHDEVDRIVAAPRDPPNHGPCDTLYVPGEKLAPVSDAVPGDPECHGGRREVRMIDFIAMPPTQFINADVLHAAAQGDIVIGDVVRRFECLLIMRNPGRGHRSYGVQQGEAEVAGRPIESEHLSIDPPRARSAPRPALFVDAGRLRGLVRARIGRSAESPEVSSHGDGARVPAPEGEE